MQIRKRVYLISGGPWGYLGNAYVVKHSEGYVMVDSSSPEALDTILSNLKYWGIDPKQITHVLLTHGHDDHLGGAKYFRELGAKIVIGKADTKMLEDGHLGEDSPCTNHVMPPTKPDILIDKNCSLQVGDLDFTIITVPGHTDGSVIFLLTVEDDLILFPGDMFYTDGKWGEITRTGWKGDLTYDSKKLGESFKKLYSMRYNPTLVLAGHGIPRFGADAEVIREAYAYYLKNDR